MSPTILALVGFFALLNLSTSGIQNFGLVLFTDDLNASVTMAGTALTAFLLATAAGVLVGGWVADKTNRHTDVTTFGFATAAGIVISVVLLRPGSILLVIAMASVGMLVGLVQPSRDMMVREAAPPGAIGRVFGIVTTGFNIGGTLGPVLFAYLIDRGHLDLVFWATALFMTLAAAFTLVCRTPATRR